ncbi:MAG TPA: DedA family protein [Candidatus Baltobacteraceae bacterium]|nr:DedA family protein [Candidatus Baltobacteraceae bacterium]
MGHLEHLIVGLVDQYGYAGLFVALLLGNIGAPIGSEVVLPTAGGLTATGHLSNVWLTCAVAVAGELAGGTLGYAIGRFGGVPFIERFGKYVHFTHERLMRVHGFFERWGTFAIFICRFLPVIRGIVAIPAGIAEMNLAHFYLWTFAGSAIFCTALIFLGYSFGGHLDVVLPLLRRGGYVAVAVAVVAVVAIALVARAHARRATQA